MKDQILQGYIPQHIAIIMDGNGRWAKSKGFERVFGHRNAIKAVREAIEGSAEVGVKYLTLYAFSTENWNRPQKEVDALMQLLVKTIKDEVPSLNKNNIRLNAIGNIEALPASGYKQLKEAMAKTQHNTGLTLTLALSYGSKDEIVQAAQKFAKDVQEHKISIEALNPDVFASYLHTSLMPDPELLIRTSGEMRISNFLLWQIAYSELVFLPILWPDFNRTYLFEAIADFQSRQRRFGKTGEQVSTK